MLFGRNVFRPNVEQLASEQLDRRVQRLQFLDHPFVQDRAFVRSGAGGSQSLLQVLVEAGQKVVDVGHLFDVADSSRESTEVVLESVDLASQLRLADVVGPEVGPELVDQLLEVDDGRAVVRLLRRDAQHLVSATK